MRIYIYIYVFKDEEKANLLSRHSHVAPHKQQLTDMFWLVIIYHIGELMIARNHSDLIGSLIGIVEGLRVCATFQETFKTFLLIVNGTNVQRCIA